MTSEQIRELALQLYTVVFESEGVPELATWQRCLDACRTWGTEPPTAMLIIEALTSYVYDGGRPQSRFVTPIAKAQAVLHQTIGVGHDGEACPARTRLTPSAIAAMIGWVLVAWREPPVRTDTDVRVDRTGNAGG